MIYNATSLAVAQQHLQTFSRKWVRSEPRVVSSLRESWYSTVTFFHLQDELCTICRSTNMIEFVHRELRRRVKVIGSFPTPQSCERIIFLSLLYIENVNLNKSGNMTSFLSKFTHN
jgi:transposase-like protein